MINFEEIREEIIRREEKEELAEIAYENKHLADVTDSNEPSMEDVIKNYRSMS
jgi:hypothetical protein